MPKSGKDSMDIEMHTIVCDNCNTLFAITELHDERLRNCHNTFYCPNGHTLSYPGRTEEARLRAELIGRQTRILDLERELRKQKKPVKKAKKGAKK
jgi:RNase P subunit RPR2